MFQNYIQEKQFLNVIFPQKQIFIYHFYQFSVLSLSHQAIRHLSISFVFTLNKLRTLLFRVVSAWSLTKPII